jgi:tRNA(Ile)-lysidine synthase
VGPHPAVAAVRLAVRRSLGGSRRPLPDELGLAEPEPDAAGLVASGLATLAPPLALLPGDLVLAACSGGADSLALAAALAFEAPKAGLRAGGIVIDHGLQPGSAEIAARVTGVLAGLGLDPALAAAVSVPRPGDAGGYPGQSYPGPEAAARSARYAALEAAAQAAGAKAIMLGHTLDDQAETVLLGLARGSGARSLAGMPARTGRYLRPLLGLRRAQTRAACTALGLQPWDDPQNADPAFSRVRVRLQLLPALETALGPGVATGLARTARMLRADAEFLDDLARAAADRIQAEDAPGPDDAADPAAPAGQAAGWPVVALAAQPAAIRHRILHAAALAAGCPAGGLSERHVASIDALVISWHGQKPADLPGGIRCERRYGRLLFTPAARSEEPGGRQ